MDNRTPFLKGLRDLLEKHGAEITCDDHWEGYAECGRDIRITVEFDDHNIPDIDFGSYIDSKSVERIASTIHRMRSN
jgi:hypothetical protein